MDISVNSADHEVIGSGTFSTFSNEKPSIISIVRGKESFKISLTFKEDQSGNNRDIKYSGAKDEKKNEVNINLELINFRDTLPVGLTSPIMIGFFDNGDKIYLQLNIRKLGGNTDRHEINYTFYLEAKLNG